MKTFFTLAFLLILPSLLFSQEQPEKKHSKLTDSVDIYKRIKKYPAKENGHPGYMGLSSLSLETVKLRKKENFPRKEG